MGGITARWSRADRDVWVWRIGLGLVLVPFAVSAVQLLAGVGGDYLPVQDHAVTEMFVRDVGRHPVLVGLYSRADWSHPGPAGFYALAPFYWLTGGASIGTHLGSLAINAASVAGTAAVARRRGGTPVLLATLVGIALVMRTLGADFLADPWNTYLPVLPYLLFLFLVWSMLCGDLWALPLATVVASFTAQTHIGFVVLALPLLVVGGVALVLPEVRPPRARTRAVVRAVGASAGLLALLWLPPALDVVWEAPSNARRTIEWFERADEGVHPLTDGGRLMGAQFVVDAEWFAGAKAPSFATGEPTAIDGTPLPLLAILVVAAAVVLWRRRVAGARALVVTLGLALVLGVVAVARTVGPAYDYRLRWAWMPPVLAFVVVAWAAWCTLVRWRPGAEAVLVPASLGILLVLAMVSSVAAATAGTPYEADSEIMATLTGPVLDLLGSDGSDGAGQVVVERYGSELGTYGYGRGLVLQLERHGIDARVSPSRIRFLPESRNQTDGPVRARLVVATDDQVDDLRDAPGYRLLAEWSPLSEQEQAARDEELDRLNEDYEAGRVQRGDFLQAAGALDAKLHGGKAVVAYDVAVFLDESPETAGVLLP